jgi:predicted ester cyclase
MSTSANELTIRNALIDNYNAYAEGLDSKNWPMVRNCFADEVVIDYGELSAASGAADEPRKADDWMEYLQGVINKFDVTRHTITNHRVSISGDEAVCTAYLTADHVKFADPSLALANPENVATVVGEYSNHYRQIDGAWKIFRSALVVQWSSGNLALFA